MVYLTAEQILVIHRFVLEQTTGSDGVRDMGLLLSLAHKPQTMFGGEDVYPDLFQKAAVLFEALANYHVFVDGNKRTAFTCTEIFLRANGKRLHITVDQGYRFVLQVAPKQKTIQEITRWLEDHAR
ncbi:type II toxin-antitoxin system death-on-curing family toxin [Candidatus Uhrbacteria bacterium]|nr:type II toxin-antitoxin system death-on-curing family toxin [Candidatus Uhrbacteria bacterium]